METFLGGLDPEQAAAVTERSHPLAIIAAAGSGKTTVLTRRIAYRVLNEVEAQAQHVLALTFTNQAAGELRRRLRQLGLRERIEAGTFHAIALRLLRQRAIDQNRQPPVIAADRPRLMTEALKSLAGRGGAHSPSREEAVVVLGDLDWCRARLLPPADALLAMRRVGRRSPVSSERLAAAAQAFALIKRRRGVVDFDDLLEQCLQSLCSDELWADGVRWRYRHLFVDEAQDLNPLQHAVLEAIRGGRPDICLVGDPRQAIFGFNGSDPEIMNGVERLYPGITIVRLRRNHRCSPQIIAAGAAVLGNAGQTDDSVAVVAAGTGVRVVATADERAESAMISNLVRDLAGVHRPWRSCAVLARTGAQLTEIARALAAAGVPTEVLGAHGRAGRPSALGAALAEAYAFRNVDELSAWIDRITADPDANATRARVAEAADRYIAQGASITFRSWVELHSPFDAIEADVVVRLDDAVALSTFHSAKGREWPSVIIAGAETGLMPHASATTAIQRDEEARLLYVACTRARERLIITWSAERNGRSAQPSPLIADIGEDPDDVTVPPPMQRMPRALPDPVYTALVTWRHNAARAAQVAPATICSDESLRAVAQARPTTVEAIAALTDLGPIAAARVAPRILAALDQLR
ncbi:MAG: UvrD-helicase domain-containing protein [Ilumatobacteraceae bacterium]